MKNRWIACFFFIGIFSCSQNLDINEFMNFLRNQENGLRQENQKNGSSYVLQYIPKELMVYKEVQTSNRSKNKIETELSDLEYFQLIINRENHEQKDESKVAFYYAYQFEKDIYFLTEGDTIRPQLYLLEQRINGANKLNINLAFPRFEREFATVQINDDFGFKSQFTIKKQDILDVPSLNY